VRKGKGLGTCPHEGRKRRGKEGGRKGVPGSKPQEVGEGCVRVPRLGGQHGVDRGVSVVDRGAVLGGEFREVVLESLSKRTRKERGEGKRRREKGRGTHLVRNDVPVPGYEVVGAVILADLVISTVDLTLFISSATVSSLNFLPSSSKLSALVFSSQLALALLPSNRPHSTQARKEAKTHTTTSQSTCNSSSIAATGNKKSLGFASPWPPIGPRSGNSHILPHTSVT
jgi:hypothetical protein